MGGELDEGQCLTYPVDLVRLFQILDKSGVDESDVGEDLTLYVQIVGRDAAVLALEAVLHHLEELF